MNFSDILGPILFPSNQMNEFENFLDQYGHYSEEEIFNEIYKIKEQVSPKMIQKFLNNLDLLTRMGGILTDEQKLKIDEIKQVLAQDVSLSAFDEEFDVDTQAFGTSLLLWFLILVSIWPKNYCSPGPYPKKPCKPRPRKPRPYSPYPYRYPYRPYLYY